MKMDSQLLLEIAAVFGICAAFFLFDVLRFHNNPVKLKSAGWLAIQVFVGYVLAIGIGALFLPVRVSFMEEGIVLCVLNIIVRLFPSKGWLFQRRNSDER